jgi:mRNA-degrading endonuclease YafQ of YafQ-DinJ toxin-antitoxin module
MWRIEEHRRVDQQARSAPHGIVQRYEKWKEIASITGPAGLGLNKRFPDAALSGEWAGYRSSPLGPEYRVIYRLVSGDQVFQVVSLTAEYQGR